MEKKINSALISVYHKDGLEIIVRTLEKHNVKIYSTGGTWEFINNLGIDAIKVEDITGYPSIFDGRVKPCTQKFLVEFYLFAIMKLIKMKWKLMKFLVLIW